MNPLEIDPMESDVPEKAVAALTAASKRAAQLGLTRVLVSEGKLVRISNNEQTVLKTISGRIKIRD